MNENIKEISETLKEELKQEKLKNEELLQKLQEVQYRLSQYEHASDGASEGLWERDFLTGEVFISPPWAKMLGFTPEEVNKKSDFWEKLIHEADKDNAFYNFQHYINGDIDKYDIDFRLKCKNGDYIWVHSKAKAIRDGKGKAIRISGSHTDITEKMRSAVKLRASEKKYKHLFENSLIGMMRVKTSDLVVSEINQKALHILALQEPKRHMKLADILVDTEEIHSIIDIIQKNNVVEDYEVKISRWDESETWISLSAVVFEDEDESFYDIIFRDISEFKGNLIELQRLNFELDNFVYHASHDIRSPLRSMIGLIEILKADKNPAENKKIIEMISGSVNRLDKFVVDLLAMSRNNRLAEESVLINFMVEINNSVTNFHHVFTTKDLEIRVKIHEVVPFYSDLTKIRIILNNLISNSIKYRRTEPDLVSFINIYVTTGPKEVVLKIEDNGEGISQDKLEKIFDMFYRASENSEGSGLGMYIVKNVIKKLDAVIKVESEEKIGTTFIVTIPNSK